MTPKSSRPTALSTVEEQLSLFFNRSRPDPRFVTSLGTVLSRRAARLEADRPAAVRASQPPDHPARAPARWRLSRRWAAVGTLLGLLVLAVNVRPVRAALQDILGYGFIPGVGFIDMSDTRVLRGPTVAFRGSMRLTVTQATVSSRRTKLWVRFSGGTSQPHDQDLEALMAGARLETDEGRTMEPNAWSWSRDSDGTLGGYLEFDALPQDLITVILNWPPDWRVPLLFESAGASQTPALSIYPDACVAASGVELCVLAVRSDEQGTHVLLGGAAADPALSLLSLIANDPVTGADQPVLRPDSGGVLEPEPFESAAAPIEQVPLNVHEATETLHFPALPGDTTSATLDIPAVSAETRVSASFQIDLGPAPQVGDQQEIDFTFTVLGHEVRFERAEVARRPEGTMLILTSLPTPLSEGWLVTGLDLSVNRSQGDQQRLVGTIFDVTTRQLQVWWDLEDDQGLVLGGLQYVNVVSAQVTLSGPIELAWRIPQRGH